MTAPTLDLSVDVETRSVLDLKKCGAHAYARHPSTSLLCMAYRLPGKPEPRMWRRGEPCPPEIAAHIAAGGRMRAWNAAFEALIWRHVCHERMGWPSLPPEAWVCTMQEARVAGLPGYLDKAASALRIPQQKDPRGKKLIALCCAGWKDEETGRHRWSDAPADLAALAEYCLQDVRVECAIADVVPRLPKAEWDLALLDTRINARGMGVDLPLVTVLTWATEEAKADLDHRMRTVTSGAVAATTALPSLKAWLAEFGMRDEDDSLGKDDLSTLLEGELPPQVRDALLIRQMAAKSSTAKLAAMLLYGATEGGGQRMRGLLSYYGADTGRWAGRAVQPHNLPRAAFQAPGPDRSRDVAFVESVIARLYALHQASDGPDSAAWQAFEEDHGPMFEAVSKLLRSCIVPGKGNLLDACDLSGIESRVLAWLAGETWKLKLFREGGDVYLTAASSIYGRKITKDDKAERLVGKVAELACLGPDTLVATLRGWVRIVEVRADDRVWDGVEWVRHEGLVARGEKETLWLNGVQMTPDHLVLVGDGWRQAATVAGSPDLLLRARATGSANSPCWARRAAVTSTCSAPAAPNPTRCSSATCDTGEAPAAMPAHGGEASQPERSIGDTPPSARTTRTAVGCATASPPASNDAATPAQSNIETTEGGASACIRRGSKTEPPSLPTSSHCLDGTTLRSNSTALTTTAATSPATCASSTAPATDATSAPSRGLPPRSPNSSARASVYDLLCCGPRSRFMVKAASGTLIVHNCGYQGAVGAFASMGKNYGVKLPEEEVVAAVRGWRAAHPETVRYWYDLNDAAIEATAEPGREITVRGRVKFLHTGSHLWCRLPSGRALIYRRATIRTRTRERRDGTKWTERYVAYFDGWSWVDLYGGLLCLSGDTLVLSEKGWVPLYTLPSGWRVWDGEEWVEHGGVVFKGVRPVIDFNGVTMTPDHEVLTQSGWKEAQHAYGEPLAEPGLDRAEVRAADRRDVRGHRPFDARLEGEERVAGVFDVLDAGPRRRFVVRGPDGGPAFIVHNCENITQATARDVLVAGMWEAERRGLRIVLHVHDEIVVERPADDATAPDRLLAAMLEGPRALVWTAGLPLDAECDAGLARYRK